MLVTILKQRQIWNINPFVIFHRSKACKKDLRQKIAPLCTSNSTSSAPISLANVNPPNATGPVATLSNGAQGAVGNASNLQHPPPAIWRVSYNIWLLDTKDYRIFITDSCCLKTEINYNKL